MTKFIPCLEIVYFLITADQEQVHVYSDDKVYKYTGVQYCSTVNKLLYLYLQFTDMCLKNQLIIYPAWKHENTE